VKRLIPIGMATVAIALTATVAFAVAGQATPPDVSSIPLVVTGRSALEIRTVADSTLATPTVPPATASSTPTVAAVSPAHSVASAFRNAVARRTARARTATAPVTVPTVIVVAPRPDADPIADSDDGDDDDHEVVTPGVRDDDDDDDHHSDGDSTRRTESHDDFEESSKPAKNKGD